MIICPCVAEATAGKGDQRVALTRIYAPTISLNPI